MPSSFYYVMELDVNEQRANYALRNQELIDFISVVVEARNKITRFVLIKKIDGQFLQFLENIIPEVEKHALPHPPHKLSLCITAAHRHAKDDKENDGITNHTSVLMRNNKPIDRLSDEERCGQYQS